MPTSTKFSITLPADQAAAVEAAVEAGEFASASDAMSAAVDSWPIERSRTLPNVERLRRLWEEGRASGDAETLSFEDLRRFVRDPGRG